MEKFTEINGFVLESNDKLERVINGNLSRAGEMVGGLGEDADPALVLAQYDRIGGFITKDGIKVKTGSFWDSKKKAPRTTAEVMFLFNIGGDIVEVDDPANLHKAIAVVGKARAEKEEKFKKAKAKSKFKDIK